MRNRRTWWVLAALVLGTSACSSTRTGPRDPWLPGVAERGADASPVLLARASSDDEDTKRRVPKEQTKEKSKPRHSHHAEEADEDESCWSSCFSDLLTSMLFPDSEDEEDEAVVSTSGTTNLVAAPDTAAEVEPGAEPDAEAGVAPEPGPSYPVSEPPMEIMTRPPLRSRLVFLGDLGWGRNGPSDVSDEYGSGGIQAGVTTLYATSGGLQAGLSLGYATAKGTPKFDYETNSRRDSPTGSRLKIFDAAFRVGQYVRVSVMDANIYWGLGPALFWVEETADLKVFALPDDVYLRRERVSLHRWRVGGDAAFGMDWPVGGTGTRLGFLSRFYLIPWDGKGKESLTLDFLGKRSIFGFNAGLAVGFDGR